MRVTAAICLSLVMTVVGVHGNTMFNRLTGPLDSDSDRDTQQETHPGGSVPPHDPNGFLVAIPTAVYNVFGTALNSLRCFYIGYCLGGATDPGTTEAEAPTESPTNTGMATTFDAGVIVFAPFIFDSNDAYYKYILEYRILDYTKPYHRHDIERLVAEKFTALGQDLNTAEISSYQGVVVTWKFESEGDVNTFQLCLLHDGTDTYVFYIYGAMPMAITGKPRGYLRGAAATDSARICSPGDPNTQINAYSQGNANTQGNADAVLPEADLPLNSNYKCGKPGVYIFKVTDDGVGCSGAATDCLKN